ASEQVRGRYTTVLKEKPQTPPPVIDLRTGEPVGEFSWKSPFWLSPRLSPDATYLVGPDTTPTWLNDPNRGADGVKGEPNALFVWKQKSDKPSRKLGVHGVVVWAEFVDDGRLALYLTGARAALQLWDVAEGKKLADIPLSVAPLKIPNV